MNSNLIPTTRSTQIKRLLIYSFIFSISHLSAQTDYIEKCSNSALNAALTLNEKNWQEAMSTKDAVFIKAYERYPLDAIKDTQQKHYYTQHYINGLVAERQENFLRAYNYLSDRLHGDLSDYTIENVIQKEYYDYSDRYERRFDQVHFATATLLKNTKTGKQIILICNLAFLETIDTAGLTTEKWYDTLAFSSFRIVNVIPYKEGAQLDYILSQYIRDMQKESQAENAADSILLSFNEEDLTIRYYKEKNHPFMLKETFNKVNKIYYYTLIIDDYDAHFEEAVIQDEFIVMIDENRMLYLDKKKKGFKGYYIDEYGRKQSLKFKLEH